MRNFSCIMSTTTTTTVAPTNAVCGSKSIVCLSSTTFQICINPGFRAITVGGVLTCGVNSHCDPDVGTDS